MKKLAPSLMALSVCISASTSVLAQSDNHFRDARWYDPIEAVKASEKSVFVEQRQEKIKLSGNAGSMSIESLYFRDTLMGKPVLVRYQFDSTCGQLFQGTYIFEDVFVDKEVFRLVSEFENRYGTKIYVQYPNGILYAVGRIGDETKIRVIKSGGPYRGAKRTMVDALTINFSRYGWRRGTQPQCATKPRLPEP